MGNISIVKILMLGCIIVVYLLSKYMYAFMAFESNYPPFKEVKMWKEWGKEKGEGGGALTRWPIFHSKNTRESELNFVWK